MIEHKNIPRKPGIYRIYSRDQNYIGASINLKNRIMKHSSYLNRKTHNNLHMQRTYDLRPESFKVEVIKLLESEDRDILLDYETYYCREYNSVDNGFNAGYPRKIQSKFTLTEDQIAKAIVKSCKKVMAFDRYNGSLKFEFDSISEAARELKGSSSNISQVCKGKLNHMYGHVFCYEEDFIEDKDYSYPNDHKKGKPHSEEHKAKMRINHHNSKPVYQYDENMRFIAAFQSRSECEKCNGFKKESIRRKVDKETPFNGCFFKSQEVKI